MSTPDTTRDYNGRLIGTHDGHPLVLVTDPCLEVATGKDYNGRIVGVHDGHPLVIVTRGDGAAPATTRDYNGRLIGTHDGHPLVLVTAESCVGCELPTTITFTVTGCNGLPLAGIQVDLAIGHDEIEVHFLDEVTDASGVAVFQVEDYLQGDDTPYEWSISHFRWETESGDGAIDCGGDDPDHEVAMTTPASGYQCTTCCAWPVAETLYFTNDWGTATLTFAPFSGWSGTQTIGPFSGYAESDSVLCDCPGAGLVVKEFAVGDPVSESVNMLWTFNEACGIFSSTDLGGICCLTTDGECHEDNNCIDEGPAAFWFNTDIVPSGVDCEHSPSGTPGTIVCDGTDFSVEIPALDYACGANFTYDFGSGTVSE